MLDQNLVMKVYQDIRKKGELTGGDIQNRLKIDRKQQGMACRELAKQGRIKGRLVSSYKVKVWSAA